MRLTTRVLVSFLIFIITYTVMFCISYAITPANSTQNTLGTEQSCTDGICKIPQDMGTPNTTTTSTPADQANSNNTDIITSISHPNAANQAPQLDRHFLDSNPFFVGIQFWLAGLLLAFTPCVLPLIILIAGFLGANPEISYKKSIALSLTYVMALACTLAIVGTLAVVFGVYLQSYFQNPWIIAVFSVLIALLALSQLGFYRIKLPRYLQHLSAQQNKFKQNYHFIEVAVMGTVATLITSPCIAAPLVGIIGYFSSMGTVGYGSLSLFTLGIGMGTPLILATTINKQLLPQKGIWQHYIKILIGVSLLAASIWISSRIIPASWNVLLWSVFVVYTANIMFSLSRNEIDSAFSILWRSLCIIVLSYGLLMFTGFFLGTKTPFDPLKSLNIYPEEHLQFYSIEGINSLDNAVTNSASHEKPVLLYFTAKWCVECADFYNNTLLNKSVISVLNNFTLLKVDMSKPNSPAYDVAKKYDVSGTPEVIFFTPSGTVSSQRIIGNSNVEDAIKTLNIVEQEK